MRRDVVRLHVGGGEAAAVVLRPDTAVQATPVPLLVAGGWGEGSGNLMGFGTLLATKTKRTVILVDYPRRGVPLSQGPVHQVVRHRADSIEVIVRHLNIVQLDIIAHSAGTLDSLEFTQRDPQRVKNIVLVTPAGFSTASSYRLARGLTHKLVEGFTKDWLINPTAARQHNVAAMWLVLRNPRRAMQEALAVPGSQAYERFSALKEQGIRFYLIECLGDRIFPPDPARKGFYELFDAHTLINDPSARHDDLIINPSRTVDAIMAFIA